jgi:hypothetical protein
MWRCGNPGLKARPGAPRFWILAAYAFIFEGFTIRLNVAEGGVAMGTEEREKLQQALRELTLENNSKEKATSLFMKDGYFDENGKLAKEFRESE